LNLKYDGPLSNLAFNFNLRPSSKALCEQMIRTLLARWGGAGAGAG